MWPVRMKYDKMPVKAGSKAMNTDTTIAKNIRVADEKAGYDAACKRLLSEKIIFERNNLKLAEKRKVKHMRGKMIDYLLVNANPSIQYRVKTEVLNQELSFEEKNQLQEKALKEPIIQSIIACQKENGWLGNGFHGPNKNAGPFENQEVGPKSIGEKMVYKDTPVLKKAMEAFVTTKLTDLCYRTKGKYFDEFRYAANGQNIIRCACIARAGYDDVIDIKPQIQLALDSFKRVLEVDSALDITRLRKSGGKEKRVFNDYEKWPCYYHLDILAHTDSWKTEFTIPTLTEWNGCADVDLHRMLNSFSAKWIFCGIQSAKMESAWRRWRRIS